MARSITYRAGDQRGARARRWSATRRVIVMGEDIAGGLGAPGEEDAWGGVARRHQGPVPQVRPDRVLDTPISESAFIGAAVGAAATGLRPVAELMFVDFIGVCFDQIFNQAAKFRYMFGGKAVTPLVDPHHVRRRLPRRRRSTRQCLLPDLHPHPGPEGRRCRRTPTRPRAC